MQIITQHMLAESMEDFLYMICPSSQYILSSGNIGVPPFITCLCNIGIMLGGGDAGAAEPSVGISRVVVLSK